MKTTTTWKAAHAFDVTADSEHTVRIDSPLENGGLSTGLNPKKLLLASLSGCSGIDVVDILQKMKVAFTKLEIEASAEQTETHPKVFQFIHLIYRCDASPEHKDKVERAVSLSHEKYCGISAMLAKHCKITYNIEQL